MNREQFRLLHRERREARKRGDQHSVAFENGGISWRLAIRRRFNARGAFVGRPELCLYPARIRERSPRGRIAAELRYAAEHRQDAARNSYRRRQDIAGARDTLRAVREMRLKMSAFHALP